MITFSVVTIIIDYIVILFNRNQACGK